MREPLYVMTGIEVTYPVNHGMTHADPTCREGDTRTILPHRLISPEKATWSHLQSLISL